MPIIYQKPDRKVRVTHHSKTAFAIMRYLPNDLGGEDVDMGELVGLAQTPSRQRVLEKVTAANQHTIAPTVLMRWNETTNDVLESNAISCITGFYYVRTQVYLPGDYSAGDFVTCRYDADVDGGVFGPVDEANSTVALGVVEVAPSNGNDQTPMELRVFAGPTPL